jgi:excisionase family DNA binding protein
MADRMTVAEAAEVLGITRDAVYKRVERNKIRYERDADGQLYVYVEQSEASQRQASNLSPVHSHPPSKPGSNL